MFSRLPGVGEHTESALCISRTKELSLSASGQINEYGKIVSILYCKCNQMQKKVQGKHQKQMLVTQRDDGALGLQADGVPCKHFVTLACAWCNHI